MGIQTNGPWLSKPMLYYLSYSATLIQGNGLSNRLATVPATYTTTEEGPGAFTFVKNVTSMSRAMQAPINILT